jgi:hypothetical protein
LAREAAQTAVASRLYEAIDEREFSPPQPAALARTDEDAKLGLGGDTKIGDSYNLSEINGFRQGPLSRLNYRRLTKPDETPSDEAHIFERVILAPAAQVRGQEIVKAYDEWVVAQEEAKTASGSQAAEKAFHDAIDVEDAALWDVTATPANTLAGVLAKARAADSHLRKAREATLDSMLEDGQFDIHGPVDLLLVSIAHDLVRLSAGGADV